MKWSEMGTTSLYFFCYQVESFSGHFYASEKVGLVKLWGGGECTRGVCSPRPIWHGRSKDLS